MRDDEAPETKNSTDSSKLVQDMYRNTRNLSSELHNAEYTADFDNQDWKEYALGLGSAFRALDTFLIQGGPFPHEWVMGITTP
ncbi:hypothetical protein AV521_00875 [Streptomyces sp. IMTB 2501]|uniref:hypothetical protein n=1 Tax=Streptomyces sp. IMTB 2501 TaxID=1776340 RepID=UPI00096DE34A|nr:hypothetical protein [Streptomyces sp. IMTB 2501]OLZ74276.1 hypothetical protein AV521_00875 [Streptomyces sp. IMTB 2501]